MAKPKKHTLSLDDESEFDLIGLCSHHSDYRLAWSINETLAYFFSKSEEDYIVSSKKGETVSEHSMYIYQDEENRLDMYLIKNKNKGKYLIPEKPTIDYFIFLHNNVSLDPEEIIADMKRVESVLGAYIFDAEELPSARQMIF